MRKLTLVVLFASLLVIATLVRVGDRRIASGKDFDPQTGALKNANARLLDEQATNTLVDTLRANVPWTVSSVEQKPGVERPAPPFTTSTLTQEASRKLGFATERTMQIAQRLFQGVDSVDGQGGLITYHRTDSTTLSDKALQESARVIRSMFGAEYYDGPRRYQTRVKNAQEAHEAIRPTNFNLTPSQLEGALDSDEQRIYELIWKRTMASQMVDARVLRTSIEISAQGPDGETAVLTASGKAIEFAGFRRAYVEGSDDPAAELEEQEAILPQCQVGDLIHAAPGAPEASSADPTEAKDAIALLGIEPKRHETSPPARFTEASLIKELERLGIGRPSTYAPTISRELANLLGMNYAYGVEFIELDPIYFDLETIEPDESLNAPQGVDAHAYRGLHGSAILSRYPIRNARILRLPVCHDWYEGERNGVAQLEKGRRWTITAAFRERISREVRHGGRMALLSEILVPALPSGRVTVVATQLENKTTPGCRRDQLTDLLQIIHPASQPVILAGDFNTTGVDVTPTSIRREGKKYLLKYDRWARQVLAFGESGQRKIAAVHAGIVGLGGIGSQVAQALGYLGVRRYTLVDDDRAVLEVREQPAVVANLPDVRRQRLRLREQTPHERTHELLRRFRGDDVVRMALTGLPFSETGIVLTILLVVFLLGFFLDWVEITLIILPLVAPVVMGLGVEPLWFAMLFAICLQTSFLTPPVGFALFYIKGVCPPGITTRDIYLGVAPFVAIQLLGLALVFAFAPLATWLPGEIYGGR